MAEKTSVEGQEEIFLFAFEDLVNGIGGALGLFLGWSILSIGKTEIIWTYLLHFIFLLFLATDTYDILPVVFRPILRFLRLR